jgi:hypothetical protein
MRAYYQDEGLDGEALEQKVDQELRDYLADQFQQAAVLNRRVTDLRGYWRRISEYWMFGAFIVMILAAYPYLVIHRKNPERVQLAGQQETVPVLIRKDAGEAPPASKSP